MTAKEYLGQAYRIDQRINSKLEQIMTLRELALKATSTLTDMPHSPTKNTSSMQNIICKIVDLADDINKDIDMLVDLKREIVYALKKIQHTEYQTLLELRYLCFKTWEQIAVDMGYSSKHVFYLHDKAVALLQIPKSSYHLG